jgi:MFS family permease
MAVMLLAVGVREPAKQITTKRTNPISLQSMKKLTRRFWWVVAVGAMFTLARFSEAFLVLRAMQGGMSIALIPLVMVAMNLVYAVSAYPFGKLADSMEHRKLLMIGVGMLIAADLVLAHGNHWTTVLLGATIWGLHMGMTQGLLATMVAETAPAELRGTAFGLFNLFSGVALLTASTIAGLVWDGFGASATFYLGAVFSVITLGLLAVRGRHSPLRS